MGFLSSAHRAFRNLKDAEIDLGARQIFLVGENGQGKSNFIESLYLLCFGGSFRTRREAGLVRNGRDAALVRGQMQLSEGVTRRVSVSLERAGRKEIRVDSRVVRDRMELIENAPCIVFSHQDLEFVSGPPEMGRRFFNQTQSLFDPLFIDLLRSYRKILRSRNILLKERNLALLEAFDRNLGEIGHRIQSRREGIVEEFNRTFSPLFATVSAWPGTTAIAYRPSWRAGSGVEEIAAQLARRRPRDLAFETTTTGPHRDRFVVTQDGKEFAAQASTGQIRLASLILRVAQANFVAGKTGRSPILLLDDVLLELDSGRRDRFLEALPSYDQAFFTFLPDEQFVAYRNAETRIYRVAAGELLPA
ncbi:MAG: DNA replication/repair protein RecF [Spirochaetales bacterium]|nr:DNA replication/repair protein RecF [Spirochaetales bacterium]